MSVQTSNQLEVPGSLKAIVMSSTWFGSLCTKSENYILKTSQEWLNESPFAKSQIFVHYPKLLAV